jgi:hypothetical protein
MFDLNPRQAAFTGPPVQNTWHIGRRTRPPGFRNKRFQRRQVSSIEQHQPFADGLDVGEAATRAAFQNLMFALIKHPPLLMMCPATSHLS